MSYADANQLARECAEEVTATFVILNGQRTNDEQIDALTATIAPFMRDLANRLTATNTQKNKE